MRIRLSALVQTLAAGWTQTRGLAGRAGLRLGPRRTRPASMPLGPSNPYGAGSDKEGAELPLRLDKALTPSV